VATHSILVSISASGFLGIENEKFGFLPTRDQKVPERGATRVDTVIDNFIHKFLTIETNSIKL
jgi:hypothetical protein